MNRFHLRVSLFGLSILFHNVPCCRARDTFDDIQSETSKPPVRNGSDRDPTAPSSRMLERIVASMRNNSPYAQLSETNLPEAVPVVAPVPDIRLKAIILSDVDRGSAILSANGKSISLNLSRTQIRNQASVLSNSPIGFTIEGVFFKVEDFSDHSILLRLSSDNSVLIVQ